MTSEGKYNRNKYPLLDSHFCFTFCTRNTMLSDSQQPCCSRQLTGRKKVPRLSEKELEELALLSDSDDNETNMLRDSDDDDEYTEESEETDEETDEGEYDSNWKRYRRQDGDLRRFRFTVPNCGFQIPIQDRPDNKLGYFQLFFTDELLKEIVTVTNIYAQQKINKIGQLPKYSIWRKWRETNLDEIKALFGVIMNMALNPKSDLKQYFYEELIHRFPFFKG